MEMDAINEVAVHVFYVNAIAYMICTLNNYFCVEQRLQLIVSNDSSGSSSASTSSDITEGISERSIANFILHMLLSSRWKVTGHSNPRNETKLQY